jgi:hypothetical protein
MLVIIACPQLWSIAGPRMLSGTAVRFTPNVRHTLVVHSGHTHMQVLQAADQAVKHEPSTGRSRCSLGSRLSLEDMHLHRLRQPVSYR